MSPTPRVPSPFRLPTHWRKTHAELTSTSFTWLAWSLTRLFGVFALHGFFPYQGVFRSDSDVSEYQQWSLLLWHGHIPFRDFSLLYPPGILPIIAFPPFSLTAYKAEFLVAALLVDALVMRGLVRSGRTFGGWTWVAAAPLLGPIFWSRLDIFMAGMLLFALLAFEQGRYAKAGIWFAWAALIKLWPALVFLLILRLVPRGRKHSFLTAGFATCAVGLVPFLALGAGRSLWHVVQVQTGRGVEFESIFAVPLYALNNAGHRVGMTIAASVQFFGSADATVSAVSTWCLVVGVCYCLWRTLKDPLPGHDASRWLLLVVVLLLTTDKVLSAQYLIWVALAVAAFIDHSCRSRRLFLSTSLLLLATQLQFPFDFPQMLVETKLAFQLSVMHAVILLFFAGVVLRSISTVPTGAARGSDAVWGSARSIGHGDGFKLAGTLPWT